MRHLARDTRGSVVVEFGLIGPMFIAMLIGVLQIGLAMQAYNAMRNASADVAREAMVQYQTGNRLSNAQLSNLAASTAVSPPYVLNGENLTVTVSDALNQRVAGAREMTLTVTYDVPTILPFMGWASPTMTYQRPMFVIN